MSRVFKPNSMIFAHFVVGQGQRIDSKVLLEPRRTFFGYLALYNHCLGSFIYLATLLC